jgi:putative oxidoreductase
MTFGLFANTGAPVTSLGKLAAMLDQRGWRPGRLWAPVISATELIGGPLLVLGLFTRLAAIPVVILLIFSIIEHRKDGWFWNTLGMEYPIIWSAAAIYILVHGAGPISLDALIGWQF